MLRDKSLIPLSHQHQRALALCVRIQRAAPLVEFDSWQSEIAQHFASEIGIHFAAEEEVLFPTARRFPELHSLVDELLHEHSLLRECFSRAQARAMSAADLVSFAQQMSAHIRKEERQLFERLQALMTADELGALGQSLDEALKNTAPACALPATRGAP